MSEQTPLDRAAMLDGRREAQWRATRHYRAGELEFEPGQVYRLRRDVSDWVERDCPGTLEAADG